MQHVHAVWNRPILKDPRHAMRVGVRQPARSTSLIGEAAVSLVVTLSLPDPTRLRLGDFGPEALGECYPVNSHVAITSYDRSVVRGINRKAIPIGASVILP